MHPMSMILAVGLFWLEPLQAAPKLDPVSGPKMRTLAKAEALFGPRYSVPEGAKGKTLPHGDLFDFTATHVADVATTKSGIVVRVSFYPKYFLEDRETTHAEDQVELTKQDYDAILDRVSALRSIGRFIKRKDGCLVSASKWCYAEYEHAKVEETYRSRLVNEGQEEYRDFIRAIDVSFEHTLTGRVRSKTRTPPSDFLGGSLERHWIEVGNRSFGVSESFYNRVKRGSVVKLTVFGCSEDSETCDPVRETLVR